MFQCLEKWKLSKAKAALNTALCQFIAQRDYRVCKAVSLQPDANPYIRYRGNTNNLSYLDCLAIFAVTIFI